MVSKMADADVASKPLRRQKRRPRPRDQVSCPGLDTPTHS